MSKKPLMTRHEAHGWWSCLASMWGVLWFAVLTTLTVPGPNAPALLGAVPVMVISLTGAFFLVWLLRVTYLAGKREGGQAL